MSVSGSSANCWGRGQSRQKLPGTSTPGGSDAGDDDDLGSQQGDEDEDGAALYRCFACQAQDTLDFLPKCLGGHYFHNKCFNAHRAYVREISSYPDLLRKHTHALKHDPDTWRKNVAPFITDEQTVQARQHARDQTRKLLTDEESTAVVDASESLDDLLLLSKVQFSAYVCFWEQLTKQAADGRFDDLLAEQRNKHGTDDTPRVAYKGIEKLRKRKGTEHRTGVKSSAELSESNYEIKRRRIMAKTPEAAGGPPARSLAHSPSTGRTLNIGSPGGACTRGSIAPSTASARSAQSAAPAAQAAVKEEQAAPETPQRKSKKKLTTENLRVLKEKHPATLTGEELMQRQELAESDTESILAKILGPKGAQPAWEKFIFSLPSDVKDNPIHQKSPKLLQAVTAIKNKVEALLKRAASAQAEDIATIEEEIVKSDTEVDTAVANITEHMRALKYGQDRSCRLKRKQYLQDRHQVTRYRDRMTGNTFPAAKTVATILGSRMHDVKLNEEGAPPPPWATRLDAPISMDTAELDVTTISWYPAGSGMQFPKTMQTIRNGLDRDGRFQDLMDKSDVAMTKNKKWSGCTQAMERANIADLNIPHQGPYMGKHVVLHEACGPYMCTSRAWAWRYGPSAFPLLGCSCMVSSCVGTWVALLVPAEKLLAGGIFLADFDSWAKTESGKSFMQDECPSIVISPGDMLYIPCGWLPVMMLTQPHKCKALTGHFIVFHYMATKLAASLPGNVWSGIATWHDSFLNGKTDKAYMQMTSQFAAYKKAIADANQEGAA